MKKKLKGIDLKNPDEFEVNNVIDLSLNDATFSDEPEWSEDEIDELDEDGLLEEESFYYIIALEITRL